MKRLFIAAVLIISFTLGCYSKGDGENLQGKWQLTRMAGDFSFGLGPGKKGDGPEVLIFTRDRFIFKNDDRHRTGVIGSFSCNETKSPKEITFYFGGRSVTGIYRVSVSSVKLSICIGEDDRVPPSEFRGGQRARLALLEFDRAETTKDEAKSFDFSN